MTFCGRRNLTPKDTFALEVALRPDSLYQCLLLELLISMEDFKIKSEFMKAY